MTHEAKAMTGQVFGEAELRTLDGRVIRLKLTTEQPAKPEPSLLDTEGEKDNGDHS